MTKSQDEASAAGAHPETPADDGAASHRTADDKKADHKQADDKAAPKKSFFRRPVFWILLLVVLACVVAGILYYWFFVRPYETTDDAFIDADIVQISPQTSGQVTAAPAVANSHVEAGDLLVDIDPASARAQLANQQAQLSEAQAGLQQAKVGVEQARSQEAEARAQADALQVQAENAHDTLARDEQLAKSPSSPITEKELSDARAQARSADAQAKGAEATVATARTAIEVAKSKVGSAEATVKAAQSQIEATQINLGYNTIKAPVAGHVVQKTVTIGSYVTPGTPMMAIVPDELYITANFKETQLSDIRIGQPVDIHVDAFPDVDFHGKVVSIQRGAGQAFQLLPPQNATGNFVKVVQRVPVRISIESPDPMKYALGPGMSVVPSVKVE